MKRLITLILIFGIFSFNIFAEVASMPPEKVVFHSETGAQVFFSSSSTIENADFINGNSIELTLQGLNWVSPYFYLYARVFTKEPVEISLTTDALRQYNIDYSSGSIDYVTENAKSLAWSNTIDFEKKYNGTENVRNVEGKSKITLCSETGDEYTEPRSYSWSFQMSVDTPSSVQGLYYRTELTVEVKTK